MGVYCERCGKECQPGIGNPEARLLKRAQKGLCADCSLTQFLKSTEPFSELLGRVGVEALKAPGIKLSIARLLITGKADASIEDVNMDRVVANWNLPVKLIRQ